MSRRHQASRRRTYGRRQHELHQRPDVREADRFAAFDAPEPGIERRALLPVHDRRHAGLAVGFAD